MYMYTVPNSLFVFPSFPPFHLHVSSLSRQSRIPFLKVLVVQKAHAPCCIHLISLQDQQPPPD